jgi:hypothetical protein
VLSHELARCLHYNKGVRFLHPFQQTNWLLPHKDFKEKLKKNSVLEFIVFGLNRIRSSGILEFWSSGVLSLAEGIVNNTASALKTKTRPTFQLSY